MRSLTCAVAVVLLAGCAKEKPATQSAPPPPPPAPAAINLADVAGNWTFKVMPATGDSVLLTYTLHATAADTGWTITFSGRKPMAIQVATMGDSITMTAPAYESMLRKGTKVSTQGVLHLENGMFMGTNTAHYVTTKADSVVHLRMEGTKTP